MIGPVNKSPVSSDGGHPRILSKNLSSSPRSEDECSRRLPFVQIPTTYLESKDLHPIPVTFDCGA